MKSVLLALFALVLLSGCVTERVIYSSPPAGSVAGVPAAPAPAVVYVPPPVYPYYYYPYYGPRFGFGLNLHFGGGHRHR